jgi:hypothetical protein
LLSLWRASDCAHIRQRTGPATLKMWGVKAAKLLYVVHQVVAAKQSLAPR